MISLRTSYAIHWSAWKKNSQKLDPRAIWPSLRAPFVFHYQSQAATQHRSLWRKMLGRGT